jgi:penicillin-binding protein 1A
VPSKAREAKGAPATGAPAGEAKAKPPKAKKRSVDAAPPRSALARWVSRLGCLGLAGAVLVVGGGAAAAGGGYWYYSQQLPSVEALQAYRPPTVTEVYDNDGTLMGELYEQRRYVIPLETIPDHVRHAFIAAEDEGFWDHGGVDYVGLVRAVLNEVTGGEKRQGASTITMQVTRNFLLTRDRTYERKIKEILLAQRIESVYDKERILWLYLNELYLGSGAYGVEAAARVYFNKHASELTISEAALIAGLAPAPSAYSPYKAYDKARVRQLYVLDQMAKNGFITAEQKEAAKKEQLTFVNDENPFLTTAPHFTEHVRRHLMERYGFDRVYKDGLRVTTTMDLELQKVAQDAVKRQVRNVDRAVGYRRKGRETMPTDADIAARRQAQEQKLKIDQAFAKDPAGRTPLEPKSRVEPGSITEGVVLEVAKSWVRVGFGSHEGYVPLGWSEWVNEPNARFYRQRTQTDFTTPVQGWEEGVEKGGPLVRKGDVVLVEIVEADAGAPTGSKAAEIPKVFAGVPGGGSGFAALEFRQEPEVEAATMTFDLATGAVRAMVGGANFEKSEFNRVTQAYRQVGSTFKPLVYAAAVDTEKVTAASIVPDVKGASYTTDAGFVWKPDNYGDDYLGNITLRHALALSKNTCTIKVLESMDPGMNDDVLYKFARKLGIGGPPAHELPADWVPKPDNDRLCPWVRETRESTICMDRFPPKDPDLTNTRHRALLKPEDVYMCRACDMSMGLGSASLTMEELMRAYSVFPTGGRLVQPYYIEEVRDRDGNVLEKHEPIEFPQVIRPEVATIGNWLLENVVNFGTGAPARVALGIRMGGKTGTTQDHKDVWFVGYTNDVLTASWVGYDEPRSLGAATTGGRTALPIFVDVMRVAAPKERDRPFPVRGDVEWAQIDEKKGTRVTSGGWTYPFLKGTAPASTGAAAGELTVDDFTEL